ncbi:MAG TPA: glycoside hydrolase family 3 protein [Crocinitomicaceae bacterium]|nr:glycoside hydrolase family 3 protein [Crocinitomicaceae bacterium]
MKKQLIILFNLALLTACAQEKVVEKAPARMEISPVEISLDSYLQDLPELDAKVNSVFNTMTHQGIVAQLIMPAAGRLGLSSDTIKSLINDHLIGGVILLNGTKTQFTNWVTEYEAMNKELGNLPFLYSADAEPSLVNRKIKGSTFVPKANAIKDSIEAVQVSQTISNDLNDIGINYNFSPVVDLAKNATVGYRGFASNPMNIIPFSQAFIAQSQRQNIIATAKHFPGHGLVSGDTHKSLQVIDGELKELKYYPPLIENGVLSIMVAHIAIKNNKQFNTNGLPSTTSEVVVQELLRDSLGFKGLIITDAMGMGGVSKIKNASTKAIAAGVDILLMPKNSRKTHAEILAKYNSDVEFKNKVDTAAKRVIRMKICLGLL